MTFYKTHAPNFIQREAVLRDRSRDHTNTKYTSTLNVNLTSSSRVKGSDPTGVNIRAVRRTSDEHQNLQINKRLNNSRTDSISKDRIDLRSKVTDVDPILWKKTNKIVDKGIDSSSGVDALSSTHKQKSTCSPNWKRQKVESKLSKHEDPCPVWRDARSKGNKHVMDIARSEQHKKSSRFVNASANGSKQLTDVTNYRSKTQNKTAKKAKLTEKDSINGCISRTAGVRTTGLSSVTKCNASQENERVIKNSYQAIERRVIGHSVYDEAINSQEKSENNIVKILKSENTNVCAKQNAVVSDSLQKDELIDSNLWPIPITTNKLKSSASTDDMLRRKTIKTIDAKRSTSFDSKQCLLKRNVNSVNGNINVNIYTEQSGNLEEHQRNSKLPKLLCNTVKQVVTHAEVLTNDNTDDKGGTTNSLNADDDVENTNNLSEECQVLSDCTDKTPGSIDDKTANIDKSVNIQWCNKSNFTTRAHSENCSLECSDVVNEIKENTRQGYDSAKQTDNQEVSLDFSSNLNQLSVSKIQGKDLNGEHREPDGPGNKRGVTSHITKQRLSRGPRGSVNQRYKAYRSREERSPSFLSWESFHFPENFDFDGSDDLEIANNTNLEKTSNDYLKSGLKQKDGDLQSSDSIKVDNLSIDGDECFIPKSEHKTGNVKVHDVNTGAHLSFDSSVHTHDKIKQKPYRDEDTDLNIYNIKYLEQIKTDSNGFISRELNVNGGMLDGVVKTETDLNKASRDIRLSQGLSTQQAHHEQEAFRTGITRLSFSPGTGNLNHISVNTGGSALKRADKHSHYISTSCNTNASKNYRNPNSDLVTCDLDSSNLDVSHGQYNALEEDGISANIEHKANVQVDLSTIRRGHAHGHGQRSLTTYTQENTRPHIDGNEACLSNKKSGYYTSHHDHTKTDLLYDGLKFKGVPCSENTLIKLKLDELGSVSNNTSHDYCQSSIELTGDETNQDTFDAIQTTQGNREQCYVTYANDELGDRSSHNDQGTSSSKKTSSSLQETDDICAATCRDGKISDEQYDPMICDEQVPAVADNRTTDVGLQKQQNSACISVSTAKVKISTKSSPVLGVPAKDFCYQTGPSNSPVVGENEKKRNAATGSQNKMNKKTYLQDKSTKTKTTTSFSNLKLSQSTLNNAKKRETERSTSSKLTRKISSSDTDELSNPSRRVNSGSLSSASNKTVGHRASLQRKNGTGEKVKLRSPGNGDNEIADSRLSKRIYNRTIDKSTFSNCASQRAKSTTSRQDSSEKLLKKNGSSTLVSKQSRSFNVKEDANKKCESNESTTQSISHRDVDDDSVKKRCKTLAKNDNKNSGVIKNGAEPVSHTLTEEVDDHPIQIETYNLSEEFTSDPEIVAHRQTEKNNGLTSSADRKVNKTPGNTTGVHIDSTTQHSNLRRTRNQANTNIGTCAKTNSSSADRENNLKTCAKNSKTTRKLEKPKSLGSVQHGAKKGKKSESLLNSIVENAEQKRSKSSVTLPVSSVADDHFGHRAKSRSIIREQKYQQKSLPTSLYSILDPLNPISSKAFVRNAEGNGCSGEQKFGTVLRVYEDAPLSGCVQSCCSQLSAINLRTTATFNLATNAPACYQRDCIADGRVLAESEVNNCKYCYGSSDADKDCDHCCHSTWEKNETRSQSVRFNSSNQSTCNKTRKVVIPDKQNIQHVSKGNGTRVTHNEGDYDVSNQKQCLLLLSKQNSQATLPAESQNCVSDSNNLGNDRYMDDYSQNDIDIVNSTTFHVKQKLADDNKECYNSMDSNKGKNKQKFHNSVQENFEVKNIGNEEISRITQNSDKKEMDVISSESDNGCHEQEGNIGEAILRTTPDDRHGSEWNMKSPDITACNNEVMNNYDNSDRPGVDISNVKDNAIGLHKQNGNTGPGGLLECVTDLSSSEDVNKQNDSQIKEQRLFDTTGKDKHECVENVKLVSETCVTESEYSHFKAETEYRDLHSEVKCDLIGKYTKEKDTPLSQKEGLETSRSSNKGFNSKADNLSDVWNSHASQDGSEKTSFQKLTFQREGYITDELSSPVASSSSPVSTGSDSLGNMCTNCPLAMDNNQLKDVKSTLTKKKQRIPQATKLQKTKFSSNTTVSTQRHLARKQTITKDSGIKSGSKAKVQHAPIVSDKKNKITRESSLSRESSPTHSVKSDDTWTSCSTTGTKRLSISSKDSCDLKKFVSIKEKKETCDTQNMKAKRSESRLSDNKLQIEKRKISGDAECSGSMNPNGRRSSNVSNKSVPTGNVNNHKSQLKKPVDTKSKHKSHLVKPQMKSSSITKTSSSKLSVKSTMKEKQNKRKEFDSEVDNSETVQNATKLSLPVDGRENNDAGKLPTSLSSPVSATNQSEQSETLVCKIKNKTDVNSSGIMCCPNGSVNPKQRTLNQGINHPPRSLQTQNKSSGRSSLPEKSSIKQQKSCRNATGSKANDFGNDENRLLVNGNIRKSGIPFPVPRTGSSLSTKQKTNNKPGFEIKKSSSVSGPCKKENKSPSGSKHKTDDVTAKQSTRIKPETRCKTELRQSPVITRRKSKEASPDSTRTSRSSTPSGSDKSSVNNDNAPKSILNLVRTKTAKQTSRLVQPKFGVPRLPKQFSDQNLKKQSVCDNVKEKQNKKLENVRTELKQLKNCKVKTENIEADSTDETIRESGSGGSLKDIVLSHISSGYSREVIVSSLPVSESFENSSGVDSPFTTPPECNKPFNSWRNSVDLDNKQLSLGENDRNVTVKLTDTHLAGSETERLSHTEADDDTYATLNKTMCEISTVAESFGNSKTVNKVLKSDLVDQLPQSPLSNTENVKDIKELGTTCRQNIKLDMVSTEVNLEQLSSNVFERSKIPSIEKHNRELMHMQGGNQDCGTLHQGRCGSKSDSGSSDDYWSISDDENDNYDDRLVDDKAIVTSDIHVPRDKRDADSDASINNYTNAKDEGNGHTLTHGVEREYSCAVPEDERFNRHAATVKEINFNVTNCDDKNRGYGEDISCSENCNAIHNKTENDILNKYEFDNNSSEEVKTEATQEIYAQTGVLSHVRLVTDDHIQQIGKHDARMRETADDNIFNEMHSHSKDVQEQKDCTVDDLFLNNKTSFDLIHENITHHEKSDEDMETILINSSESSETRGNCAKDKNQYVSTDYEEKLPEQANLGEYFDDGIDKLEMQAKELNKGDRELLKSIKLSGSSYQPTEESLRGSMDNISHLSFSQNILTHQNNQDVLCSRTIRNKTRHTQLSSALLTPEHLEKPVTRVNEEPKAANNVGVLDQELETKNEVNDIINKNCEKEFGEFKSSRDQSSNGIYVKNENHEFDTKEEGSYLDVYKNSTVLKSPESSEDVTDNRQFVSNGTCEPVYGLENNTDKTGKTIIDDINLSTDTNICGKNKENYDELSISEEDDSEDMTGQMGFYQANMAAKTLKPGETGETSSTIVAPQTTISHSETCIKYEIVTTTITKHKKRETKIIESCSSGSNSNLSTTNSSACDSAVLHERHITSPRKVRNSRSVKFESKEVKTSKSDSQGNVYSSVKNTETEQVVESGIDREGNDGVGSFTVGSASILSEKGNINAIENPVNVSESFNVNNEAELQERLCENTGSVSSVVNSGLNTNNQGNGIEIHQQGNNKLKSIHGYPDLSSHVTGGQFSKLNDATFKDIECRNESTQRFNLVTTGENRDNRDSVGTRTDIKQPINSRTELKNAVHNSENDDCRTSSSFKQVNASIVSNIDKRDLKSTCGIDQQTDLSESGIKEIETFKTSSNALSLTERSNTRDNRMRGDTGLLSDNSTEIPGVSSTSNTSNAKNIYENKMGIGDNTFDNHTSLQSRIETPKVAILVTRNQSESDNGEESSDPDAEDDQNITDFATSVNKADNGKFSNSKHDKMVVETKLCLSDTSDTEQLYSNVVDSVSLVNTLPEPEQVTNIEEENYFTVTLPVPPRCVSVTLESSLSTADLYNNELSNQNLESNTTDTEVCFSLEPLNSSNDTLPDIEQTIVLTENSSENILRDEGLKHASESCSTDVVVKAQQMKVDCLGVPDRSVTSNENDYFKNSANEDRDFESDTQTHQTENTDDVKSQKREIDRQNLRRYTATVCLVDIKEGNSDSAVEMSPPSRPRARSKSPVELKNMGAIPESKQQVSVFGNGRVSNICRTFIEKSRSKGKRVNNEPPPSPLNQSPSPTRKQKWLRDNGVWKKVSLDEYERIMAAKANFSSITSDDTLSTSADDDQPLKEVENRGPTVNEIEISSKMTKEESPQCNKIQKDEKSTLEVNLCKNKAGHTPKIPPKTLPKPKYRRKSKDPLLRCDSTSSSISTPEEITNIEETLNNTQRFDTSFDADKTLVAEDDILNTSTEKNEVLEKIIDSSSDLVDKTPDVQIVDAIVEKSDDKENLSNISSLSYETTQTAEHARQFVTLSGDLSDVISDNLDASSDVSQDEESTKYLRHNSSTDDLNVMTLKLNHTPENKDKTSPQDDLSFAEKLKKAEHRFGKCSPAVLESKDVFKPRRKERVTLQPLKKKNDNLKVKESNKKCDVPSETKSKPENKNVEKTSNSYVAPALVTRSPQKLRAVRIKQEIFPKEEPVTIQTPRLTAIKISQETFPKEETKPEVPETESSGNQNLHDFQQQQIAADQGSLPRDKTKKKGTGVKFYVGDEDTKSWEDIDEEETVNTDDNLADLQQRHDSVVKRLFGTKQFPKRCINPFEKFDNVNVNIRELTYQRRDLQLQSDFESGVADSEETLGGSTGSFGLLSEIVELEENNGDDSRDAIDYSSQQNQDNGKRVWHKSSSAAERFPNKSPVPCPKTYSRSHSLPSGTLSYPGSRIVYKDGHFVIETGYCEESSLDLHHNEELPPRETIQEGITDICDQGDNSKSQDKDITISDENRKKLKRISYSEPQLCDNEDDYDEEENLEDYDADVFLQNDGDVTVIDRDESCDYTSVKPSVPRRNKPDRDCRIPRPLSVDENQLLALKYESEPHDSPIKQMKKSVRDAKARRSKSFKEMSDRIDNTGKLKRNSSFKEAQEKGPMKMSPYNMETRLSRRDSTGSSREELRPKSPGFLQRLLFKRKSFSEKGSKPGDAISRESFMKKMSLKGLFANKKDKPDSSSSKNNEPQSPPIAAFQGDLDIHAVDSAPNSPFTNLKFRRRHTSADIYSQNQKNNVSNNTLNNVRRTSECKQNGAGVKEDQTSIRSYTLGLDHPKRPISPKPSTVTITRRNSNLSLPSSPLKESPFELSIDNSPNKFDTDSISTCSINSSNLDSSSLVSATNQSICDSSEKPSLSKQSSASSSIVSPTSQDLEKLSNLVQGGEMTSSNSNDSGIQHDVSVHSSSESLKTSSHDSSSSSVIRRRKSPSPRPERPKSEISVRWADLVETNEITPVKRRESSQRNRPRPKSDIEENLELFDELCGEVIGDFDSLSGGSSLKSDMKPFGSQMSLQPYCSLQSLDSLRIRQEAQDQKPSKRRMSTPQPIKTRLDRSPRKRRQRKSSQLVRSQSMPESLDKLHRRKRLHNMLGYSNLHCEDFLNPLEEDSSSDDGSEFSIERISLNEKCMSTRSSQAQLSTLDEMPEGENLTFAEALWDHITMDPEELGFHAGDVIEVMDIADKDWWWGAIDDREGWFPATFVRLRVNQERFEEEIISQSGTSQNLSPTLRRVSIINKEQARENVVNEIISAEREYVKHLKDVVEGYIKHARKRQDMFSEDRICVIFGNIEEIYNFSNRFLQSLDDAFNADSPHYSELGHCFLTHSKEFEIYSDYCNNHPSASEELKDLYRKQKYRHFFEACRLLQEMIEIPLEGFLLTPVQKICKYPLQLAELLKFTPSSHPDFNNVQAALEAMKKIAALINERKRKMESIEKLARWQHTVEDWQGPDLLELSSELIMSGEFNKVNSAGWSQERYFFLFDHQLIYCKKDLLKKNGFSYKGRVDMDECEVIPVEDGKDVQYNVTVKNAWKLHETLRDKWYLLYTKTPTEKQRWLRAFQTERQRVQEDQENNFVPVHWKKTVLNKLRANKEKQQSTRNMPIQYQKEFLRGIPSHATLPRSYAKKHKEKKKAWSIFGNKKTK